MSTRYQIDTFPTVEWFNEFGVDWNQKRVVDYGCAEGVMSHLAKEAGASRVLGIDKDIKRILQARHDYPGIQFVNTHIEPGDRHDIGIFSMIIHWLDGQEQFRYLLKQLTETAIIVYRKQNDGYRIPENGNWFPTSEELDFFLSSCCYDLVKHKLLMTQDNGKEIELRVYRKWKNLYPCDTMYLKTNTKLGKDWVRKLEALAQEVDLPLLYYGVGHYVTRRIEGKDLRYGIPDRPRLKEFIAKFERAFEKTGLMFTDFTLGNIVYDGEYHFVDYDEIDAFDRDNQLWKATGSKV